MRGGARGHGVCYVVPSRVKAEASNAVITRMVQMCHHLASTLFDSSSTYSCALAHHVCDIDIMCELLFEPVFVSILIGESFLW